MLSRNLKIKIVNKFYDIRNIVGGDRVFCEFHNDLKPSAKVYGNAVYCFACRRFYYVYNYVVKLGLDLDKIFDELVKEYGSVDVLVNKFNESKDDNFNSFVDVGDIDDKYLRYKEVINSILDRR